MGRSAGILKRIADPLRRLIAVLVDRNDADRMSALRPMT
jgi:hypothetical protein